MQVTCAIQGLKDVVGKESRRWEVPPSETVALQDVADDGRGQFGHRRHTSAWIFLCVNIFKEASGINALWDQKGNDHIRMCSCFEGLS